MKTHCKAIATALAGAVLLSFPASAKTFDWPIDATTAGARQFTAYHGETVRFNLQLRGAMTNLTPVAIYYQTNGMGKAEWFTAPGTVFHPTNDCGAASYRFFVLCTDPDGKDYTANGSLRMLDSPGFEPSSVQLPAQTLDFAKIAVLNPPWPAADDLADATNKTLQAAKDYTDSALGQGLADYFTATNINGIAMSFTYTNIANGVWGLSPLIPPLRPASCLTWSNDNGWQLGSEHGVVVAESSAWRWTPTIEMQNGNTVVTVLTRRIGIAPEVDFSTNNVDLVETIGATAPAPGNYAAVSNAAMNAALTGTNAAYAASAAATNALDASLSSRLSLSSLAASNYTDIAVSRLAQRTNDWDAAAQNASDALAYSRATYDFQQGNTNAWFSGTNYVFGADATNKTAFAFEPGMDLMTMPCSLALMEIRDGLTQKVWDQRDWTVWYWNFKNAQQEASIAARFAAAAEFNATNYAPIAWGRRTSSGLANPDKKTLWVDAEKTVLAPGMAWESTVEVSGCAYWTIVGNAKLSGNTNGVISILDFEGNPVFRIRKTASHLVTLETGSEIYTSGWDAQGRITYTMRASVHPVGVFSTVLDDSLFVEETNAGCPVDYEWETLEQPSANSPGVYRIHFLLKPGISSDGCFAKFKVEVQGETAVEFFALQKITGGQVYDDGVHGDVKIRPVITSTAVGSVVTWEVAP